MGSLELFFRGSSATGLWMSPPFQRKPQKAPISGNFWDLYLVGGILTPLKNMSSSIGMMTFPMGKYKSCSSHHQPEMHKGGSVHLHPYLRSPGRNSLQKPVKPSNVWSLSPGEQTCYKSHRAAPEILRDVQKWRKFIET